MTILSSQLNPASSDFQANKEVMLRRIDEWRAIEGLVIAQGEKARAKFNERDQLLPRERLATLLDPHRPFLELSSLAGLGMHEDDGKAGAMGGGCITGIGFVEGRVVMVIVNDSAIKGGTITPMGLKKTLRAQEIAYVNRLPTVSLVESGGANLAFQSELFVDGGKVFCNMARASAAGLPQITVVHGSSTAGGAYIPGLSDYVIAVKDRAQIFLAGPPLVKAALGEVSTDEELGGAMMHATTTGTVEYVADNDRHALQICRAVVAHTLPTPHFSEWKSDQRLPRFVAEELCGLIPIDPKEPFEIKEVIARIADDSAYLEFKPLFGTNLTCGHASIESQRVGILGNNGPINPDDSRKAAQFIQLCCQADIPLIYLQNTTGYMVGREAEQKGAIKQGSLMIQAVANASVPQITVIINGGYGAGNYGMCGRAFDPRFIFAWPTAKVAVMGGEQAASVMRIVLEAKYAKQGVNLDQDALKQMSASLKDKLDGETNALFATARIWDDGIIDPRDTRRVLGMALAVAQSKGLATRETNMFGVSRF